VLLLDTHVWIWAADGGQRLGAKIRRRLGRMPAAAIATPAACLSVASIFEVVALHTAGRLHVTMPIERWIRESIDRSGFRILDLDREVAVDAGLVPASALADPIDRWLVATAREHGLALVTADRKILDHASLTRLVRVIDASS
jgi:PIN domain nuclease of toxin-antitoxin system